MKIAKLILPVAGLGKRLRPLTDNCPKALVKINSRPLLDYALEEARAAGLKEVALVLFPDHKHYFEDYLKNSEFGDLKFEFFFQKNPFGNGRAVLAAADFAKGEPVAVRFCDDILITETPVLSIAEEYFNKCEQQPILFLEKASRDQLSRYGVVAFKESPVKELKEIVGVVEKPAAEEAPSDLIIIGSYILTPEVFAHLKKIDLVAPMAEDGLMLTDAFISYLQNQGRIFGFEFRGRRLDGGTLEGIRQAEEFFKNQIGGI